MMMMMTMTIMMLMVAAISSAPAPEHTAAVRAPARGGPPPAARRPENGRPPAGRGRPEVQLATDLVRTAASSAAAKLRNLSPWESNTSMTRKKTLSGGVAGG